MSDGFQFLAATDVNETDAPAKGAELVQWLIREGIVAPGQKLDFVLGEAPGYPPGPRFFDACENAGPTDFPDLLMNVVAVNTTRQVYDCGQGGIDVSCPACDTHFSEENGEGWRPFVDAISEWWETCTPGKVKCIRCGTQRSIVEWQREGFLVLANLGLEFWNWPTLSRNFLITIEQVTGSSIRRLAGKR